MIELTKNQFHKNKTWSKPIVDGLPSSIQHPEWINIFDQDGYRLTMLESYYAAANHHHPVRHGHEVCLKQDWFTDAKPATGPHLNHALLFERKAYEGEALEQLKEYASQNHHAYKLINYKGKWGLDLSIDYVDSLGNSMELLHYEYDSFELEEIESIKEIVDKVIVNIDWNDAAKKFLERKDEWINLKVFEQSKWKSEFYGLPLETYKCIAWE